MALSLNQAEFLLSTHMDHFSWREGWPITFKALLGESLFLQGEEHRRNRRLITLIAERSQPKLPLSLIGFGGGPRICVGLAFAKLEMKLVAAHLLRHYDWQLLPNQSLEPLRIPTRRPQDRLLVQFRPLSQSASQSAAIAL